MKVTASLLAAGVAATTAAAPIPPGALDSYPAPSPDHTTLLFVSSRGGQEAIWIAQGDGSSPRLFLDGRPSGKGPGGPVWSPDGRKFAFAMRPMDASNDEETDIYTANADGSDVRRLTSTRGDDSHPHWSGDGKRIFFNSVRATPDLTLEWSRQWNDVYSMAADGSDVRRHTDCKSVCTYATPSPDGKWIVYRKVIDGSGKDWSLKDTQRNSEVFLMSMDGSIQRNLSQAPAYDGWPTWTADSQWILFVSNRDGRPDTGQLYAVRPGGDGLRRLTDGPLSKVQPWPSADSKQLYYAERVEDERGEFGRIATMPLRLP